MLNVVGERHTESGPRRSAEKQFCSAKTLSNNYWVEHEFPDLHQQGGGRGGRGGRAQEGQAEGADLMELRAAHGAAMLVVKSAPLVVTAAKVAKLTIVLPHNAAAEFDGRIQGIRQFGTRISNSWRPSRTNALNSAAQAVFTEVENACQAYFGASRGTVSEQQAAAQALSNSFAALRNLLPALENAVGVTSSDHNAGDLALHMRTQRSSFMGLAAIFSSQLGVWKIGDGHIDDLVSGRAKVDMSRANFVTRDEFNQEFAQWLREQIAQRRAKQQTQQIT
jgi:hypothetical protein